jgi:hypothetical protein
MAEEVKDTKVTNPDPTPETDPKGTETEDDNTTPNVQDLLVEIAKLKRATTKATAEAAEYKRKLKAAITEQEAADMEKAELEAKKEERLKALERNEKVHNLVENYMSLNYSKEQAKKAAEAMVDGDMDAVFKIQSEVEDQKLKAKEAEWLAKRPEPAAGTGEGDKTDPFLAGLNSVRPRFAQD